MIRRLPGSRRTALWAAALLLPVLLGPRPVTAQDRVVLVTGVALEGEIKSASRGTLSFDNEELDVVEVDLEDVRALTSPFFYEVHDAWGGIYRGSLLPADSGMVRIGDPGFEVRLRDIVEILRFDATFWGRTSGFVDVGLNITQANSLRSFSLGGRFAYRGPRWGWRVNGDGYWQTQETSLEVGPPVEEDTRRGSIQGALTRFWVRWAAQSSLDWERNDELDLDSRVQIGLQALYTLIENQSLELRMGAGLSNNTESYVGEEQSTSAEVVVGGSLDVFDIGDIDIYTLLQTYTNLNQDRYRLNVEGRISWEVIDDFYINFNVREAFDSHPPSMDARKRDYRYGLSIGWSWS